jgi:hypothetical protein
VQAQDEGRAVAVAGGTGVQFVLGLRLFSAKPYRAVLRKVMAAVGREV